MLMEMSTRVSPDAIKAWKVSDDEHCHIVWCNHGLQARRIGAQALDLTFDDVECERFPQLDGFEGDLLGWMLEAGWTFECGGCYRHTGLEYEGFIRDPDDDLYCSETCAAKDRIRTAAKKRLREAAERVAEERFAGQGPRFAYLNIDGDAFITLSAPIPNDPNRTAYQIIERKELDEYLAKES